MLEFILAAAIYVGVRSLKVDIMKQKGRIAVETVVIAGIIALIF